MLPRLAHALIEAYTQPGDCILDPMSGIGTTGVEAIELGRDYVGVELEARFVRWQEGNLALARQRRGRQRASGQATVIQGDARDLAALPRLPATVDAVITSPPYGDRLKPRVGRLSTVLTQLIEQGIFKPNIVPSSYGSTTANLGNLADVDYLAEMRRIYTGCFARLKPGGHMVVVMRPGRDHQRLRPLHHDTARMCTAIGFDYIDELAAVIGRVELPPAATGAPPRVIAHGHFWKRLHVAHLREAGFPVTLEQIEYVLVFQKPGEARAARRRVAMAPIHDKSGLAATLAC